MNMITIISSLTVEYQCHQQRIFYRHFELLLVHILSLGDFQLATMNPMCILRCEPNTNHHTDHQLSKPKTHG